MLIAQITDLHLQHRPGPDGILPAEHLRQAVDSLRQLPTRPDLVVVTGDLTEHGAPDEYALLRAGLERLEMPYRLIPGNHDHTGQLRAAFPELAELGVAGRFIQYVDDAWPVRLVALDTTVPGKGHGALCAARLQWLAERLAEAPAAPTVVLMHHPPFETGIHPMDAIGLLEGRDEFARIVAGHHNIERILCGHLHRTIMCQVGGVLACTCPSTVQQIQLNLVPSAPLAARFEPPGYQLHWVRPGRTVTHHAVVGHYDSVYYA